MSSRQRQDSAVWFALVDVSRCRLLRCRPADLGGIYVDEVDIRTAPPHVVSRDTAGESIDQVISWLEGRVFKRGIDQLAIFAPAGVLAAMADAWSHRPHGEIQWREANLMHLGVGTLARHPMVKALLSAAAGYGALP